MGPAVLIRETTTLCEVAKLMLECAVDEVVVVDADGAVRGVVTERALTLNPRFLRMSAITLPGRDDVEATCIAARTATVGEVMDSRVTTASVDKAVGTVVDRMIRRDAEYALVLRDGAVIGLLGRRDLLRLIAGQQQPEPVAKLKRESMQPLAAAYVPPQAGWPALGKLLRALR
jgi:CBS domain-containing protein